MAVRDRLFSRISLAAICFKSAHRGSWW